MDLRKYAGPTRSDFTAARARGLVLGKDEWDADVLEVPLATRLAPAAISIAVPACPFSKMARGGDGRNPDAPERRPHPGRDCASAFPGARGIQRENWRKEGPRGRRPGGPCRTYASRTHARVPAKKLSWTRNSYSGSPTTKYRLPFVRRQKKEGETPRSIGGDRRTRRRRTRSSHLTGTHLSILGAVKALRSLLLAATRIRCRRRTLRGTPCKPSSRKSLGAGRTSGGTNASLTGSRVLPIQRIGRSCLSRRYNVRRKKGLSLSLSLSLSLRRDDEELFQREHDRGHIHLAR